MAAHRIAAQKTTGRIWNFRLKRQSREATATESQQRVAAQSTAAFVTDAFRNHRIKSGGVQRLEQVPHFLIHVQGIAQRVRHFRPHQFAIPLAQAKDHYGDGFGFRA